MSSFFVSLFTASILILPFYILLRWLYVRISSNKSTWVRELFLSIFFVFLAALLTLVFKPKNGFDLGFANLVNSVLGRLQTGDGINLVPFYTIKKVWQHGFNTSFAINIVANIFMFAPVGFLMPLLWKRWQKPIKIIIFAFGLPVIIEFVQLFIGRRVDVDDVILNAVGIIFGFFVYEFANKVFPKLKLRNLSIKKKLS